MSKYVVSIIILISNLLFSISFASGDRVSLGYIYSSSMSHAEIVNRTNGNINTVSPTCLDLDENGHLVINNIFDLNFIDEMHSKNILVTPFLSNHWGRKRAQLALSRPDVLASEVVNVVEKYNLDGVNVDLENLLASDRDKLTNFVKVLREKLPEGKILSVAVASNPKKLKTTWIATYDYAELAKYSDYLMLMAYDEHSSGGVEGPVASIDFVEESVKTVLESVSRDKVVLGMPLYGRYWKKGEDVGGEAIVASQIERIAERYNVVPIYDFNTGTATFTIDIISGEKKAYVNGRYLEEGSYTIYYEDENSIMRKLELVNEYGLKGVGLWALGNENENFWEWYEKGFTDENYESEKTVNERVFYEYVEELKRQVDPLRIERKIELGYKNTNKQLVRENYRYVLPSEVNVPKLVKKNQKIIRKNDFLRKTDKAKIVHIVKRYEDVNKN